MALSSQGAWQRPLWTVATVAMMIFLYDEALGSGTLSGLAVAASAPPSASVATPIEAPATAHSAQPRVESPVTHTQIASASSQPRTEAATVASIPQPPRTDTECDAFGVCAPFELKHGSLFVRLRPGATSEPELWRASAMHRDGENGPYYSFPPTVKHVVVDIGTNMDPDSITDFWRNDSIGLMWFEPQKTLLTHCTHLAATRQTMGLDSNRVVTFPAAVAPENGMTKLYLSATHGCTSLLPMNKKALDDPSVMKDSFKGGDKTFRDFSTSKIGFVNCIKEHDRKFEWVPTLRGSDLLRFVHPSIDVLYVAVDAQGFDMQVAASFGKELRRAHMIQLECQDLPHGHGMFLTVGSYSCAEIRFCIESQLPHVMVNGHTGLPDDTCCINNPSEERNCMFRRMESPYFRNMPYLALRAFYKLRYGVRKDLVCPKL